jgi:hypothetical protein
VRPSAASANSETAFTMQTELNGHAVGIILKELVRRAMAIIRNERQVFEVTAKQGHSGSMDV